MYILKIFYSVGKDGLAKNWCCKNGIDICGKNKPGWLLQC